MISVRSALSATLPEEAFLRRHGERVVTQGGNHLDFSTLAAHARLDSAIDHLVGRVGIDYFKINYNVTPGSRGLHDGDSVGAGLLAHS